MDKRLQGRIEHVVVLMLENRSFDQMLGNMMSVWPDCDGVDGAHQHANTLADGRTLRQMPIKLSAAMTGRADPPHDFASVTRQLGGLKAPDMSGFAQTAYDAFAKLDTQSRLAATQEVMNFYPAGASEASDPLPALQGLARHYGLCDRWFSALPGPTWPNRLFALTGSCFGGVITAQDYATGKKAVPGILRQVTRKSLFTALNRKGRTHQIYSDFLVPISTFVREANPPLPIRSFLSDVKDAASFPSFAWIEPNYGGGGAHDNSQHPPEDPRYGDALIAQVYNALRSNEALWRKTLFIVTYDEHGGFYDHVVPPLGVAPDDCACDADPTYRFDRLGARVPTVLVSPWIKPGVLPKSPGLAFDHTSLLAFVCDLFELDRSLLGERVRGGRHFGDLPVWLDAPRGGESCPLLRDAVKDPIRFAAAPVASSPTLANEQSLLLDVLDDHFGIAAPQGGDLAQRIKALRQRLLQEIAN